MANQTAKIFGTSARSQSLAGGALLASNALFALGGMAGYEHRTAFGLLYLLSAAVAIPMVYLLVVAVSGRGATFVVLGAVLLGVAAIGHTTEAVLILVAQIQTAGKAGPLLGLVEFTALVGGMLLLAIGLWRAAIAPIWPGLFFLLILPIGLAVPHGLAQQSARSAILVIVTAWLSHGLWMSTGSTESPAAAPDAGSAVSRSS